MISIRNISYISQAIKICIAELKYTNHKKIKDLTRIDPHQKYNI